ncbi:hypothetical protein MTsPCn9_29410 [Croceitalea sp. MTPC9]|uniref:universal stress protein n=1 Tax=unclassified Croceitalea TaxID=2632280 RepID=UPI002B37CFC7|nr:hypothetical protein MTsPCn6_30900 [Croceitalea sp. MTPC6]GMN18001.1 hypothetical protein MTsPCn9_29410 [Croceitalea sp. MTPC9]
MKNIVVATDFSNDAYAALFYVTKLLSEQTCTIYILNVFDEHTPLKGKISKALLGKKGLEGIATESKEKLASTLHKIVLDLDKPAHHFQILSKEGELVEVIKEVIAEHKIDLLVMGSKGETGAKEIFLGSNTINVAKAINKCPILAVPKQADYKAIKEIAFVTDFKKGCTKEIIAPLLFVASLSGAAVRIMHIVEEKSLSAEQRSHKKLLELCLKNIDHSYHWTTDFPYKAQVIDTFLQNLDIDMFAMVHHRRSFLGRLARQPVIKELNMRVDTPFLILPDND